MARTSRNKPGAVETGSVNVADSGEVALLKAQDMFEKNKKVIIGAVVAILVLVGGYFGYKYFIQQPKIEKSNNDLAKVQNWFEADSLKFVIDGDGQTKGGLSLIKKYSGTPAANLANFYVGMSYLKTGDAQKAIKHLSEFDGNGTVMANAAALALGDAYMDAGQNEKGIAQYKKVAADEKDDVNAPICAFRAGLASEMAGKMDEAKKYYSIVKEKFPMSMVAQDIDKYLARVGVVNVD